MSLVEMADVVVVIDDGQVVESGTPRELLVSDSFLARQFQYARLKVSQARDIGR
jgi:ABC-type multidrug transport system fused ATPase/permease subunit